MLECFTFSVNTFTHSRKRSSIKCTRSAFDIYLSFVSSATLRRYTCFVDYGFLFSSFMLSQLQAPCHGIDCSFFLYSFLFILISLSRLSRWLTHNVRLHCIYQHPWFYITLLQSVAFSFHSVKLSSSLVFLVMVCNQVLCCEHDNRNAVSDLKQWKKQKQEEEEKQMGKK